MKLLMLTFIAACNGFQISNLKDKSGKNVFLFDDGSLQAIESSDYFHSRFQIDFIDNNNVVFKNVNGYFLSSDMSWVQMDETFTVEKQEEFVSFKNTNSDYLTVSTDGRLSFETASSPDDEQMFVLSKHCSKGEQNITLVLQLCLAFRLWTKCCEVLQWIWTLFGQCCG